jgi:hypothetical protein
MMTVLHVWMIPATAKLSGVITKFIPVFIDAEITHSP